MRRPTAIIDMSVLLAICKQDRDETVHDFFSTLLEHYQIVVPTVLVEEVWVKVANSQTEQIAVNRMVAWLLHLRDTWIDDPFEIAFSELVRQQSIQTLPQPPMPVMESFFSLPKNHPELVKWVNERRERMRSFAQERAKQQAAILDTGEFAQATSYRNFVEKYIRPKFKEMLSETDRKRMLLDKVFGETFRARHPDYGQRIEEAFEAYSVTNFDKYPVTLTCILTSMVYFYAPLVQIVCADGVSRKILNRNCRAQWNNLYDEQYVQSAMLCARLLTSDKEMRTILTIFKEAGLWSGHTVFIDQQKACALKLHKV
jgi:hypothetical protein